MEREQRARRQRNSRRRGGRGKKPRGWKLQSHTEERVAKKTPTTERSYSEIDTAGGGEVGTSQSQLRRKKGHMTNRLR